MKCDRCLNCCVPVMSENGMHYNCCLHPIAVRNCLLGKKDHFEELIPLGSLANEADITVDVSTFDFDPFFWDETMDKLEKLKEGDNNAV